MPIAMTKTWIVRVFAVGVLAAEIFAQECDNDPRLWFIRNQSQVDTATQGCTTLNGDIIVANSYSGSLVLDGLENLNGTLDVTGENDVTTLNPMTPNLTSIELPDLRYADSIWIQRVPALTSVSAPKATLITSLISNGTASASFDFSALEKALSIDLIGNYTRLNFSQLATVTQKLAVCSELDCIESPGQPIQLAFPALQSANGINLVGSISNLSMPVLASVGYPEGSDQLSHASPLQPGLTVYHWGDPLSLDFPQLSLVVESLSLTGDLDSVSLSALKNTTVLPNATSQDQGVDIRILSHVPLSINFTTLEYAYEINLNGSIAAADFPVLQNVTSLNINTSLPINCSSFDAAKKAANQNSDGGQNFPLGSFTCYSSVAPPSSSSLSTGTKVGIGVGVGVGGSILVTIIIVMWSKLQMKKRDMIKLQSESHDLPQRVRKGD